MDIITFKAELADVLVQALVASAPEFATHEMKSFDLGIHPWHGYIEPSFLTTHDTAGLKEIGDWKLYNFVETSSETWTTINQLAKWMKAFYEENPEKHSTELFVAASEVLQNPTVTEAMKSFRKTSTFFVSVYNPDDSSFANFCA